MTVKEILDTLRSTTFRFQSEGELQDGIAAVLHVNPEQREVRLTPQHRIDFLIDGIGIEIKTDGSLSEIIRQLYGYAMRDEVTALLLVTTRSRHRPCPPMMNEKPVCVVFIGGAC